MISYYELLGMIKEGTNPKQVKFNDVIYEWSVRNYSSKNHNYLTYDIKNRFDDIDLFDENIELVEEEKDIEEIDMFDHFTGYDFDIKEICKYLETNFQTLNEIIGKLVREVNRLRKDNK